MLEHQVVCGADRPAQAFAGIGRGIGIVRFDDCLDRFPTRHLTGLIPAHAIGHDKDRSLHPALRLVRRRAVADIVLIEVSTWAGIAAQADLQAHGLGLDVPNGGRCRWRFLSCHQIP